MEQHRAEYMVDGTAALPSKMIRSTAELLVWSQKRRTVFQIRKEAQKKHLSFLPNSILGECGEPGVKGRDERKERALDTGLPTPTPLYALGYQKYP
jgi:hypothetical protein